MGGYTVCLLLSSGEEKRMEGIRANRAEAAIRVAVFAHDEESMVPIRHVQWIAVEGVAI